MKRRQRVSFNSSGTCGKSEIVGRRARDGLVFEGADAVEPGFLQPVEQKGEVLLGLAGKTDDERRADRQIGADRAPGADALQRLFLIAGPAASP